MVNIPLLPMDDYGLLEPTDVGTMTIGYDPKDDVKNKRIRWDQDEVICMLKLIKEHNLLNRFSITKMSCVLSQLMLKKGYTRTDKQIQLKLTAMRKNFLTCERQKLMNGNLKECPFYKELREVYRDVNNVNAMDFDDFDSNSQDGCLVKFPNDPVEWQKNEIQKMLNIIKTMKLKNELTLTYLSPFAIKVIAENLQNCGYERSHDQVRNALMNLRSMYVDYKIGYDNNENPSECMFFSCLDLLWSREYRKCRLKDRLIKSKTDYDEWSVEETIVLLTLVKDLNIADEAYDNTEKAAKDLKQSLAENGYSRNEHQIKERLGNLKEDFTYVHTTFATTEALNRFPFYNVYKKLFELQYSRDMYNDSGQSYKQQKDNSLDYADFCSNAKETSQKYSEEAKWTTSEVKLLLKTVRELTSGTKWNESLEDEKLQKLVQVLRESSYYKTAEQIKYKLAMLKNSYLRCNFKDSSERDIFGCPFYNELHAIFHTSVSDERYEFIQNLLSENVDVNSSKFPDHSYTNNNKIINSSAGSRVNDKVTVLPNRSLDTWFPVESIISDDGIGDSSSMQFNDLSGVSNKEHEQDIEDALIAALPNTSDNKIETNPILPDDGILAEEDGFVSDNNFNAVINNLGVDQEITTTDIEKELDFSKIYRYGEDPDNQVSSTLTTKRAFSVERDELPPSKKPRIIDDEKIGKNKFLLKPVESMNASSLSNITNTNKFVRLIVANDPNKTKVNHITAHIEPLNVNTASSVSSGMSSPIDRVDILKLATEKIFCDNNGKNGYQDDNVSNATSDTKGNKFSETIKDAIQTMMKHDEVLQQKHHAWMEKQFELQRKHDEEQKISLVTELRELKDIMKLLLGNQTQPVNQTR